MKDTTNIRVLIATGLYPPEIGGPATYTRMLEEKLPGLGCTVEVIAFSSVRHLPKIVRHATFFWSVLRAGREADVLYALDPVSVGVPTYLVSVLLGKKFIIRLGGDYAWEQGQQRFGLTQTLDEYTHVRKEAPLQVRLLAAIQSFVVKRARLVIAPSEYLKNIIVTWGVEPSYVHVVYSALSPLAIPESKTALRESLGYEGAVITSAGRLVPWKGFAELMDAFSFLLRERPQTTLLIIGDGPEREALEKKVRNLHLEGKVRFLGRLDKKALGESIKASDLFVLNTSYEGLSHQLLEVMELGVPIVSTRVGGNPELIRDEISGILVEPCDTEVLSKVIARLLDNEQLRQRMVQNARVRLQDFTQEREAAHFVELLSRIVTH